MFYVSKSFSGMSSHKHKHNITRQKLCVYVLCYVYDKNISVKTHCSIVPPLTSNLIVCSRNHGVANTRDASSNVEAVCVAAPIEINQKQWSFRNFSFDND